jgi:CTP synthase
MPTKYIFVSGGVLSGLGKGISSASIALLLQSIGLSVTTVKCENYLNIDAGTINPIEHGDPFLCEDGTEADMDMGTYEKFLDKDMHRHNFVTMGQIYKEVIERERRFEYNGEDVEAIPHITDEIISRIDKAAKIDKAEVVIIELGGTVGEYQNMFYYEAARILTLKNPGNVLHVHVSYLPTPPHLGEPKTKPTQQSVRMLNSAGIQPDFIIARSEKPLDKRRRDRFSLFCNMHPGDIISSPDAQTVYEVPIQFHEQSLLRKICQKLDLTYKEPELSKWIQLIERIKKKKSHSFKIAIVGKYFTTGEYQLRDSYAALMDAIDHAAWFLDADVKTLWIDSEKVEKDGMTKYIDGAHGVIVPIGWGERGAEGMIQAAGFARDNSIPYLGLCYGMQLAVISYARDILGWKDANTVENVKDTKYPVIHLMPAQKEFMERRAYGGTMRLGKWEAFVQKNTIAFDSYKKHQAFLDESNGLTSERHRHRYEFNDKYSSDFEKTGFKISARSVVENLAEIIELPKTKHPFYLGTQGHPEYKSRPLKPHPIFIEFIRECINHSNKK